MDDFDGVTLLEGQLVFLHSCVTFLDHVLLTCARNGDGGCELPPQGGLSHSSH